MWRSIPDKLWLCNLSDRGDSLPFALPQRTSGKTLSSAQYRPADCDDRTPGKSTPWWSCTEETQWGTVSCSGWCSLAVSSTRSPPHNVTVLWDVYLCHLREFIPCTVAVTLCERWAIWTRGWTGFVSRTAHSSTARRHSVNISHFAQLRNAKYYQKGYPVKRSQGVFSWFPPATLQNMLRSKWNERFP